MKERRSKDAGASCKEITIEEARAYEEVCLTELRNGGYRITMPRVQVIRALADTNSALSAYAIHEKIIAAHGKIDVVSVYRILATLEEIGVIHHIGVADGYFPNRLEGLDKTRSMHFVCKNCKCVVQARLPEEVATAATEAAKNWSFSAEKFQLEVVGTCSACK
jgi:Fe2+ or Zn2+ uptake regulation protein